MSSDRHELLAKILQVKYELENSDYRSKSRLYANLNSLLDQAIGDRNLSRYELLEALKDRMDEYRRQRKRQELPWGSV